MKYYNEEMLKLSGLLSEQKDMSIEDFAEKRYAGAKKISMNAKEKGGVAMLTYYHFIVKLPHYKNAADGKFNLSKASKTYKDLCSELHSHMEDIGKVDEVKFQKLVGEIEVIGELIIKNKDKK